MSGGFGQVGFGRFEAGQAGSDIEPRFELSIPGDGSSNVGTFKTIISCDIYCFSSRVQEDNVLYVEISSNGGGSYIDAYKDGSFVGIYNGSKSRIDFQQSDSQQCIIYIHRLVLWPRETQIVIRVTAQDEYGNVSTKEVPLKW